MDGFAVGAGPAGRTLRVVGERRAGAPFAGVLGEGEAVRASTGAAVPEGADGVLQLELAEEPPPGRQTRDEVAAGRNVRAAGSDVGRATTVLRAGTRLGPAELGVAVTAGLAACTSAPSRGRRPHDGRRAPAARRRLEEGQLHDSNGVALAGLVAGEGGRVVVPRRLPRPRRRDARGDRAGARERPGRPARGGVSVGPHDHVKAALAHLGVARGVLARRAAPGQADVVRDGRRPLVFGLPGNPVSSWSPSCSSCGPRSLRCRAATRPAAGPRPPDPAVPRSPGRDEAVRVRLEAGAAPPTGDQGSHRLTSMLGADALALVPRGEGELPAGAEVDVELSCGASAARGRRRRGS